MNPSSLILWYFALTQQSDFQILIEQNPQIHLVLVQKDLTEKIKVIGVANISLRAIFYCGRQSSLVELHDPLNPELITGVLDITIELNPKANLLQKEHVEYHFSRQDKLVSGQFSRYLMFAKQWWNDYLQIRSSHSTRLVKIFANNEMGKRAPVTNFIHPTQSNVTFWESLTGLRYNQKDVHHFKSVGCCFNNTSFHANIQVRDSADQTSFNFKNSSQWKLLDHKLPSSTVNIKLLPTTLNVEDLEEEIHFEIRQAIEYFRQDHHLGTVFDEKLELLQGQCVWNLENAKLSNLNTTIFGDDFQMGIKQYIPEGHTFKGFPHCFNHVHSQRIISGLMKIKQCRDVVLTRGDMVRLAIKVSIFPYCEGVLACWVMIGSRSLIYA
ncbi:Centrosomal protein of 76 kDa [Boothiomyces macroporosus]|uniref:Centrosomal protein of 76 kDa n=1 Tax=Boothiomyces macroporosus TaxID=261099 RepID=A0AAD5UFQ7_9FUNG|nr:Centrosomal protein of 76 kDa [Boothiomyces macroporosus]